MNNKYNNVIMIMGVEPPPPTTDPTLRTIALGS